MTRYPSVCPPSSKQATRGDVIKGVPEHAVVQRYLNVAFDRTQSQTCSYVAVQCHPRKNQRRHVYCLLTLAVFFPTSCAPAISRVGF
jgi:hypothetical protein